MSAAPYTPKPGDVVAQPGRQQQFLSSPADIAIYGGARGGGKTFALLMECTRHAPVVPGFSAAIFRRTYPQITAPGGLSDSAQKLYGKLPPSKAPSSRQNSTEWVFQKTGARLLFRHLQYDQTTLDYYGAQICLLAFDQLEQFSEKVR